MTPSNVVHVRIGRAGGKVHATPDRENITSNLTYCGTSARNYVRRTTDPISCAKCAAFLARSDP